MSVVPAQKLIQSTDDVRYLVDVLGLSAQHPLRLCDQECTWNTLPRRITLCKTDPAVRDRKS